LACSPTSLFEQVTFSHYVTKGAPNFHLHSTSSVSTYLQTIRSIADELTLIGNPVDDIDLVIHTPNGLGPSFKEFTASIRTRDTPLLFNDLYDKLVDFEMFLQREENLATTPPMTANYVHGRQNNYGRGRNFTRSPSNSAAPKNKKATPSDEQVTCQFCEKDGHIAKNCYKIRGFPRKQRGPPRAHIAQATKPANPELPNPELILYLIHMLNHIITKIPPKML
jgi:hypothetical protein